MRPSSPYQASSSLRSGLNLPKGSPRHYTRRINGATSTTCSVRNSKLLLCSLFVFSFVFLWLRGYPIPDEGTGVLTIPSVVVTEGSGPDGTTELPPDLTRNFGAGSSAQAPPAALTEETRESEGSKKKKEKKEKKKTKNQPPSSTATQTKQVKKKPKPKTTASRLKQFSFARHPILPNYKPDIQHPVSVVWLGGSNARPSNTNDAGSSLVGLERSKYIRVVQILSYNATSQDVVETKNNSPDDTFNTKQQHPIVLWIDWASLSRDCHVLQRMLLLSKIPHHFDTSFSSAYWVYWDTSSSTRTVMCQQQHSNASRVHLAKQSIVVDRYWNQTKNWIEKGSIMRNVAPRATTSSSALSMVHIPHVWSESFVNQFQAAASSLNISNAVLAPRPIDVTCFVGGGGNLHYYSLFRRRVCALVERLGTEHDWNWMVWTMGHEDAANVSVEYVRGLLQTKVTVIAQPDEWEDGSLLMESLASGSLVLTDAMMAPPSGLANNTNAVFYDNEASLERLLLSYLNPKRTQRRLKIAQKGLEYATTQRSWHHVESALFGKPLTHVDD